jgi:hypothetical protein
MKNDTLLMLACLGCAMIVSTGAQASYQGVTVTLHTSVSTPAGDMSVYRAYALFSNPGDYLTSVAGSPSLGNLVIQNLNSQGMGLGSGFYNPAGTNRPPLLGPNDPEEFQWETFVSIGGPFYDGSFPTSLSPGFPTFISGPLLNSNNVGWFVLLVPQGLAGNGVANLDGLGNWGVLMMQLTVNAGEHVAGTVAIGAHHIVPLAGGTTFQTQANQTFSSFPAPGALAIFALAGLGGSRSRRRVC